MECSRCFKHLDSLSSGIDIVDFPIKNGSDSTQIRFQEAILLPILFQSDHTGVKIMKQNAIFAIN